VVESDVSVAPLAYRATWFLVKDGEQVGEEYTFWRGGNSIPLGPNDPVYSPDGSSLAWVAPASERREFVVRDGIKASQDYDGLSGIAFSPDGKSLAFHADDRGSIVIRDGVQVGPPFGNVVLPILYSPNGKSIAFRAEQGRRAFIVRDGVQVTPDYEEISNIVTTPDGKTLVFAAIRDRMVYRVEVPWAEEPHGGAR
jgi:WD40 repeat protein